MTRVIFGLCKQDQEMKQKQNSSSAQNVVILGENIGKEK